MEKLLPGGALSLHYTSFSELCGTKRLLQSRMFGVKLLDISTDKVEKEIRQNDPHTVEYFIWCRDVINMVTSEMEKTGSDFTPILHTFEFVMGSSAFSDQLCHLLFTDMTTRRYILVEPTWCHCCHCLIDTKRKANVLFNILKFIGYDPVYVKYIDVPVPAGRIPKKFFTIGGEPSPGRLWGQIDEASSKPALTDDMIAKVEKVISRHSLTTSSVALSRNELGLNRESLIEMLGCGSSAATFGEVSR